MATLLLAAVLAVLALTGGQRATPVATASGGPSAASPAVSAGAVPALTLPAGSETVTARTPAPPPDHSPVVLFFRRTVGVDPVGSELTLRADGAAMAMMTLGGIDGEVRHYFTLSRAQLRGLELMLGRARLRTTDCCDVRYYIYWLALRGHVWRLAERKVPRSLAPLFARLDAITDAHLTY